MYNYMDKKYITKCILFYPIYLLSFIVLRNKKKICFGGSENARYLFLQFKHEGIRPVWLSENKKEIAEYNTLGYEAYRKYSLKGIFHALTSKVFVFTHGASDVNLWAARGAILVNLFHGLPLKKISKDDSKHKAKMNYGKYLCPNSLLPYNVQLCTTEYIANLFSHCFNITHEACVSSIYPRNQFLYMQKEDVLSYLHQIQDKNSINFIEKLKPYSRVYIYMPTWRDTGNDFIEDAKFDCEALNEALKKNNALFIFKLHPFTQLNKKAYIEQFSNMIFADPKVGVYPILPFTDVLVTDYSSVYMDYVLMRDKGTMFFQYDIEEYTVNERDFYVDITKLPGLRYYTFKDMVSDIEKNVVDNTDKSSVLETYWTADTDTSKLEEKILSYTK